jgi:hypothetical protein
MQALLRWHRLFLLRLPRSKETAFSYQLSASRPQTMDGSCMNLMPLILDELRIGRTKLTAES